MTDKAAHTPPSASPSLLAPDYLQDVCANLRDSSAFDWSDYITDRMEEFSIYDGLRPKGHVYEFHTHAQRVAWLMSRMAHFLNWSDDIAKALYLATLPHDLGKMSLPIDIWDSDNKPTTAEKQLRRTHVTEGLNIIAQDFDKTAKQQPFAKLMLDIMENHHEALDGSGLFGKTKAQLSLIARMACICDAFDGYSVRRPHFGTRDLSIASVIMRMSDEKAGQFDPELLDVFCKMMQQHFQNDQNFVEQYNNTPETERL